MDYTDDRFEDVYNDRLANGLGNYVTRILALYIRGHPGGIRGNQELINVGILDAIKEAYVVYITSMESFDTRAASGAVFGLVNAINKYINTQQPWKMTVEQDIHSVLLTCLEILFHITVLIEPIMPETAKKLCQVLELDTLMIDPQARYIQNGVIYSPQPIDMLFPRIMHSIQE